MSLAEALRHPAPEVLAVAVPVLHERDVVGGEHREGVGPRRRDGLDVRRGPSPVALLPDAGGERVGVAHEDRAGRQRGAVLVALLAAGDHREVGVRPSDVAWRRPRYIADPARLGHGAPDLRHPTRLQPLGERARQGRRPGRLRAGDHHAPAQVRADGRRELVPERGGIGADLRAGDQPRAGMADVLHAPALGQQVAVALAREHRVDRVVEQPLHQLDVPVVDVGIVEVDGDLVPAGHHAGGRVPCPHPLAAQGQRDALGPRPQHEHGDPLALRQRVVDELVMAGVRRQELAED